MTGVSDEHGDGTTHVDPDEPNISDLIDKLEKLEETVDEPHERAKVLQTIALVKRMPGSRAFKRRVQNYTTRDIAEGFVGGIIFSLPLLVEDGVFEIAEWFVHFRVGPVPIFLAINIAFIVVLVTGLLYYTDIRDVKVVSPIFGVIPRRLVGVLTISFIVAASMMYLWGRLHEGDPTPLEAFGRISVLWVAAAFGAALGDILPGESHGTDIGERFAELTEHDGD